jgi:hypothetical protein
MGNEASIIPNNEQKKYTKKKPASLYLSLLRNQSISLMTESLAYVAEREYTIISQHLSWNNKHSRFSDG